MISTDGAKLVWGARAAPSRIPADRKDFLASVFPIFGEGGINK